MLNGTAQITQENKRKVTISEEIRQKTLAAIGSEFVWTLEHMAARKGSLPCRGKLTGSMRSR